MAFLCCGSKQRNAVKDDQDSGDSEHEPRNKIYINVLPLWKGQGKQGVRYAPAILNAMAKETIGSGKEVVTHYYEDQEINDVSDPEEFVGHMNRLCRKLSENLANFKSGDTVLNFGGDHSIAMATIQKMYHIYPDLRVIWIDAHADINSPKTSISGNFHGMPVYFISDLSDIHENSSKIQLKNIAYFGVRDLDVEEIKILKENSVRNYTKADIIKRGSNTILTELITEKELLDHPVHISFDIDAIDPTECPSTGTTAAQGLSARDVVKLCRRIKETGNLVSIDIVEFNPLIGDEKDVEKTVQAIMSVMKEII